MKYLLLLISLVLPSVFVVSAETTSYTTPGSYTFTVPAGVTSVTATVVGGGGGGGGAGHFGDTHEGHGGGSGGYYSNQAVSVTPGQQISVVVGAAGCGGHYYYVGLDYGGPCPYLTWNGASGGDSSFDSYTATGGGGGGWAIYGWGVGIGGSPNGVNGNAGGVYSCWTPGAGGNNGTGYGSGGQGGSCSSGYSGTDGVVIINYTPPPPPAIDNVTISSATVSANGTTQYTITESGTDPYGGNALTEELVLINYQGSNAGAYRGDIGWSLNQTFPWFGGSYKSAPIACSGGGYAAIFAGNFGPEYLNLISCSTSVSGNTRTVSYVVTFNTNFVTPTTNNTLSGFVYDGSSALGAGWTAFLLCLRYLFQQLMHLLAPRLFLTEDHLLQ